MDLARWIDQEGSLVRSSRVRDAGYGRSAVESAIADGTVKRLRRTWLHTRNCDDSLRAVAAVGGHLTCVSAAAHLGLWTLGSHRTHIALPRKSGEKPNRCRYHVHYNEGLLSRPRHTVIDPIENVLAVVTQCQPFEHAVAIAESAIRNSLISSEALRALPVNARSFHRVAEEASELSDSGLESIMRLRLSLRGVTMKQQVRLLGRPVDGLIGERLVIQTDGSTHLTKEQKQRDAEADAQLQLRGYTVFRFTYWDVMSRWDYVEHTIMQAIAQRKHLA